MNKTARSVNFELLRIMAMFLVVVGHYIFHGLKTHDVYVYWDVSNFLGWVNYIFLELTYIFACIAVNCYVMITGYFCISKIEFRWNGFFKTIFATLFYSLLLLIVAFFIGKNVTKSMILNSLFPVHQELYWFVSAYLGLMIVAPFLARLVAVISKRQYQILLGALFVLSFEYLYGSVYADTRSILFFSFLFLIAGYIKLYGIPQKWKENKGIVVLLLWGALFSVATLTNVFFCDKAHFLLRSSSNNCMILFLSIVVFVYFAYTKIKNKLLTILSKVSPYVFGVYLLHDNSIFRMDLWHVLIPIQYHIPVVLHCFIVAATIMLVGVLLDYIRQMLFKWTGVKKLEEWVAEKMPQLGY